MSDPQTKLGQLIPEGMQRDAVHIAVAPVRANEMLRPADPIRFVSDDRETVGAADTKANTIGIVDPYLANPVKKGERFWMFLMPNSITALNHVWEHPSFTAPKFPNPFLSKLWMAEYAKQWDMTAERLIHAATDYLDHGNRLYDGGRFEGESVSEEFWRHYEKITGRVVQDKDDSFFSCSC